MRKWNSPLDPGALLRRAAAEGNIDQVKSLLDKNYINQSSSNGNTALHWSVLNQRYATTKLLLTFSGIDIEAKNKHGDTPLHLAAKLEDKKIVYRLIKAGAGKKNIINKQGFSPLDYAYQNANSFIVDKLKQKLPNLPFKDHEINPSSYKNTALHTLIANEDEKGALAFIDLLIANTHKKFNFNLRDSDEGKTCLCLAVKMGLPEVAKKLIALKNQVDVNIPDEDGNTPLHYALLLGHTSIATELLANKADKNAKNKNIKNPYELLMSTDSEDVRDCLETIWINPDRKVKASKKTYSQLCMENREHAKNKLADYFTNTSQSTDTSLSTEEKIKSIYFLIAAATGDLTNLQNTCDPIILNQVNAKGNTALHLACQHGHEECVTFLLQQPGIDLYKPNYENIKAVDIVNNELLANLFEEKLQTLLAHKAEKREDATKINPHEDTLTKETISTLRN